MSSEEGLQVDDAYTLGERCGGKPGRGSENKVRSWQPSCRCRRATPGIIKTCQPCPQFSFALC